MNLRRENAAALKEKSNAAAGYPLLANRNIIRCSRAPLFEHLFDSLVELVDLLEQIVVPNFEFRNGA